MTFLRSLSREFLALLTQIVELPLWVWIPLYLLAVLLLASIALGVHS